MVIATVVSLPLGIWAGLKPRSIAGQAIMAGSILGFSLPSFWVGLMLIMVFSIMLGWLPTIGRGETVEVLGIGLSILTWDGIKHIILPALNLSIFAMALISLSTSCIPSSILGFVWRGPANDDGRPGARGVGSVTNRQ